MRICLAQRQKIVKITNLINVLVTINPVEGVYAMARTIGEFSLVDGAQSLPHFKVDVQSLGFDFFTFSVHKIFAPTCIGAPYRQSDLLDSMSTWQGAVA